MPYRYTRIIKIIDEFLALGLIDEERASPGDNWRTGRQSRMRATPLLVVAFDGIRPSYDVIETIPPEAAFRPLDQGGCPLVK